MAINLKIVALSDTHCQLHKIKDKIPDGDILIHAGDLTYRGTLPEMSKELNILGQLPHKHKIVISGNHDFLEEKNEFLMQNLCDENGLTLLNDSSVEIEGIKIWGSPWTPWFNSWAFNAYRGEDIKKHWDKIDLDTNILITHGMPYGILDEVFMVCGDPHNPPRLVGCEMLLERIKDLKQLKYHFAGHIHSSYGMKEVNGVTYFNVSICDEMYHPNNPVTIVEYEKEA